MSNSTNCRRGHVTDRLSKIISREFGRAPLALDLFGDFLTRRSYCRDFALRLIGVAGRGTGEPWEVRRLAALMLENQMLKLSAEDTEEYAFLFARLGLMSPVAGSREVADSVLGEGYSTTHLCRFVLEFRRRLGRLNRVHDGLSGGGPLKARYSIS